MTSNPNPADPTTVPRYEVVVTRGDDVVHREPCETLQDAADVVAAWEGADAGVRSTVVDLLHGTSADDTTADQEVSDMLRAETQDVPVDEI